MDPVAHVPLSDTYGKPNPQNGVWDPYHMNSVQLTGGNKFLVGMRNTWAAYLIDLPPGRSSGRSAASRSPDDQLHVPTNAQFQWQHDVELHTGNIVSVFDDHCCAIIGPGSSRPRPVRAGRSSCGST